MSCPSDVELLAMATGDPDIENVRSHVETCANCRERLGQLSSEVATLRSLSGSQRLFPPLTSAWVPDDVPQATPKPAMIGRYVVLGELGSGGQADVYRVLDPDLGRNLVLKLSRRRWREDEGPKDALLAEGRLLAELDHPGLLQIFDVGIYDSRPYLVLEYVSGPNLEQHFAGRKPTAREAARLIATIARVVDYAHHRGVIHGDIKPQNVLIDGEGRARLIDLGLARLEDAWREEAGASGGTPEFLPPELATVGNRHNRASKASDVFGLGATLYWLLTGRPPFAGATVLESLDRARRCDIDLRPLSQPGISRRLAKLCQQALAADPRNRPAVDQWAAALDRAASPWRRRLTAAVAVTLLLVTGIALWQLSGADPDDGAPQLVLQSAPEITVLRNDRIFDLSNVLPLRAGDRVAIACDISPGEPAIIMWLDATGRLQKLKPARAVIERVDRLTYPASNEWMPLATHGGTEMVFFCRGEPPADDVVDDCFRVDQVLAQLPSVNYLTLRRGRVSVGGPLEAGSPEANSVDDVKSAMEQINRRLSHYFPGVGGVAFSHRETHNAEVRDK